MPSKNKQYNLVQSDDLDTRIPLMPEEAFQHGIPFNCKFIGSMDIPRPTSRVEIVAAMRRVRVEFKSKGVKKKKVTLTVSVDGIKTTLRKKNRKRKKFSSSAYVDVDGTNSMVVLSHPIYRIFYVSHDSQDVKIFSYIARETSSNLFHCCVFKAANKNQAMRIVRTVGQAFEVCHKLVGTAGEEDESELQESDTNVSSQLIESAKTSGESNKNTETQVIVSEHLKDTSNGSNTSLTPDNVKAPSSSSSGTPPVGILASSLTQLHSSDTNNALIPEQSSSSVKANKPRNLDLTRKDILISSGGDLIGLATPGSSAVPTPTQTQSFFKDISERVGGVLSGVKGKSEKENLSQVHEAQLLKEQLEQQTQNTRAALAQIQLLRDQLAAESAARIEAQARTHQLLIHNKELLDHLQTLVRHIQELESVTGTKERITGSTQNSIAAATATGVTLPQLTPRSKIERWFSFVVPPASDEPNHEEDDAEENAYVGKQNLRLSRRTLLSNKESGFVSETNELTIESRNKPSKISKGNKKQGRSGKPTIVKGSNSHHHHQQSRHHHRQANINRLSSTSSWLRRVLRLKRSQQGYNKRLDYWNNEYAQSSSTGRNNNRNKVNSSGESLQRVNSNKSRVSDL